MMYYVLSYELFTDVYDNDVRHDVIIVKTASVEKEGNLYGIVPSC